MNYDGTVLERLTKLMGTRAARDLYWTVLAECKLERLQTADHLSMFADALMTRGGVHEVMGRALKTQALLNGARRDRPPRSRG